MPTDSFNFDEMIQNEQFFLFFLMVWFRIMQFSFCVADDIRRPVWNIAHMANAAYQVDYYLNEGANSIEFDVTFDSGGVAKFTFHGVPCDCWRVCTRYEQFVSYLKYVSQRATPSDPKYREELILIILDLKLSSLSSRAVYQAGVDIATKLLDHYWQKGKSGVAAYVLLSLPSASNYPFIVGYRTTLIKQGFPEYVGKTGYDFSGNEDLERIKNVFKRLHIDKNIWQSDGITNCLPRSKSRLKECLWRRDLTDYDYISKVYWWSVDKRSTMRSLLRLEVDGIMTNYPRKLVEVLNENEFSNKFRMATIDDNPFTKYRKNSRVIRDTSYVMASDGNITRVRFNIDEDEEILNNCEPPDEEHWMMEVDPFPEQDLRLILPKLNMSICVEERVIDEYN